MRHIKSIVPGNGMAVKVLGSKNQDIEYALRIWKRKVKDSDMVDELRKRMEFEKPTAKKRRLHNESVRNAKRNQRK